MKFGMVGLGRMGGNVARHALEKRHAVVGYTRRESTRSDLAKAGLEPASSVAELVAKLSPPRIVFLYVPPGAATESMCEALRPLLGRGDIVVDGGNSRWTDAPRRSAFFAEAGVYFLDAGTSSGASGARHGACFTVGGDRHAYRMVLPILTDLAADDKGVIFVGPPGAGHFAKLVHNAIEVGMVQAIAEGVELLDHSGYDFDLPRLFDNWLHGSVIRSWLIELMAKALRANVDLEDLSTYVEDSGEVKWILEWALDHDIPTPVVSAAQTMLMQYRDLDSTTAKAVALLRNQFGGHPVYRSDQESRHPQRQSSRSASTSSG